MDNASAMIAEARRGASSAISRKRKFDATLDQWVYLRDVFDKNFLVYDCCFHDEECLLSSTQTQPLPDYNVLDHLIFFSWQHKPQPKSFFLYAEPRVKRQSFKELNQSAKNTLSKVKISSCSNQRFFVFVFVYVFIYLFIYSELAQSRFLLWIDTRFVFLFSFLRTPVWLCMEHTCKVWGHGTGDSGSAKNGSNPHQKKEKLSYQSSSSVGRPTRAQQ